MSDMLFNEFYYLNHDDEGNEYLIDNSFGGFLTHEQADRIITLLTDYRNKFTDEEIVQMREANAQYRRDRNRMLLEEDRPRKRECGYVYVLKSEHGYKIGKSKVLKSRMSHFGTKLPFKVTLLAKIQSEDYEKLEKEFHEYFRGQLINGEWYDLGEEDLSAFEAYKGYEFVNKELN